jgi:hypothetical protein
MILGGFSRSSPISTGRTWALRKGIIGASVFGTDKGTRLLSIQHADELGKFEDWNEKQFKENVKEYERLNRSLEDIKVLVKTLGSAVAVGLQFSPTSDRCFGALTFDTLVQCRVPKEKLLIIEGLLADQAPAVIAMIAKWRRYRPLRGWAPAVANGPNT